jgi:HPt (histidine-containing phosphotransfer) domain-containing protein
VNSQFDTDDSNVEPWRAPEALQPFVEEGDLQFIWDVVDAFDRQTRSRVEAARAALTEHRMDTVRAQVHGILGGAKQLGFEELGAACQELESPAVKEEAAQAIVTRIERLFERATRSIALARERGAVD